METKKQKDRFYKMSKALQLVEGIYVASLWAHLNDGYDFFKRKGMVTVKNTLYQSSNAIKAFTGIGVKAQARARNRLVELGFIKFKVAAIKGQATKTTHYILYPDIYKKWVADHDYDELRDTKYKQILATTSTTEKLDEWINENVTQPSIDKLNSIIQKQKSKGTFANPPKEHLQSSPGNNSKSPKEHVIDTIEVETIESENTQSNKGCVFSGAEYPFLNGKNHEDLLDGIIEYYTEKIKANHPDFAEGVEFDYRRYIGNLNTIDKEFKKLDINAAANFFVGIHGYVDKMEEELYGNQFKFKAAVKLENFLRFKQDEILNRDCMNRGELVCNDLYNSVLSTKSL